MKFSQIKNSPLLVLAVVLLLWRGPPLPQTSAFLAPGRARVTPATTTRLIIAEKQHSPMRMSVEGLEEEDVKEAKENVKDAVYDANDKVSDAVYDANDAVSDAADDVKEAVNPDRYRSEKSLLGKLKDKIISLKDTVKEKARKLKDKIGAGIKSIGKSIKGED